MNCRFQGVYTICAVRGKDVYFMPLVAQRRVLAPTSERSTVLGFALRGIKHTSFPVGSHLYQLQLFNPVLIAAALTTATDSDRFDSSEYLTRSRE